MLTPGPSDNVRFTSGSKLKYLIGYFLVKIRLFLENDFSSSSGTNSFKKKLDLLKLRPDDSFMRLSFIEINIAADEALLCCWLQCTIDKSNDLLFSLNYLFYVWSINYSL